MSFPRILAILFLRRFDDYSDTLVSLFSCLTVSMDIIHADFEKITKNRRMYTGLPCSAGSPHNATGHSEAIGPTIQLLFERRKLADYTK